MNISHLPIDEHDVEQSLLRFGVSSPAAELKQRRASSLGFGHHTHSHARFNTSHMQMHTQAQQISPTRVRPASGFRDNARSP